MSEPMRIWHHPIHSDLDHQPTMEVTTELKFSGNVQSTNYFRQGISTTIESTSSFDKLITTFKRLGEIMNNVEGYNNGIAKITYNGKTYNMRDINEIVELRRVAIHYIGLPDL